MMVAATPELNEENKAKLDEYELELRMSQKPEQRLVYGQDDFGRWGQFWI
jgi:hypothetical protein